MNKIGSIITTHYGDLNEIAPKSIIAKHVGGAEDVIKTMQNGNEKTVGLKAVVEDILPPGTKVIQGVSEDFAPTKEGGLTAISDGLKEALKSYNAKHGYQPTLLTNSPESKQVKQELSKVSAIFKKNVQLKPTKEGGLYIKG